MLKKTDKILIAGQEGMVGSAIYNLLKNKKYKIIECKRKYLDFTNFHKVSLFFILNVIQFISSFLIIYLKYFCSVSYFVCFSAENV